MKSVFICDKERVEVRKKEKNMPKLHGRRHFKNSVIFVSYDINVFFQHVNKICSKHIRIAAVHMYNHV